MMKPLRAWDKGCHGEVKCFTGIKSSCFQPNAGSWQPQRLQQESWDKEWLREVLACEHKDFWLLPATRSPGDPGQTPGAPEQDTEVPEGWAHPADEGQAGNRTGKRSKYLHRSYTTSPSKAGTEQRTNLTGVKGK